MIRSVGIVTAVLCLVPGLAAFALDDVRVEKDVDYATGAEYANGRGRLDLYLPAGGSDFPTVVYFHGGELMNGDKGAWENIGSSFAAEGVGVAVANYRLSPAVSHPAHAEDAARAVAWVKHNIADRGGNPDKVFISGHSAGGYLAALVTVDPRYLETQGLSVDDIAGAIPISAFFYVHEIAADRPKEVWGDGEEAWKDASPSSYVRSDVRPILVLYADGDVFWRREQNERFAASLMDEGSDDVEIFAIPDRDHGSIVKSIAPGDQTLEAMLDFVLSH